MDIKFIRQSPEKAKEVQIQRFKDPSVIDRILELDAEFIKSDFAVAKCNQLKRLVSMRVRNAIEYSGQEQSGQLIDFNELFNKLYTTITNNKTFDISMDLNELDKQTLIDFSKYIDDQSKLMGKEALEERNKLINSLGNFLGNDIPISNDEENNAVIYSANNGYNDLKNKLGHYELAIKAGILDTETGSAIAGNRGYFLKGFGVKLNMALMLYGMEFLEKKGYTPITTPHFMNPYIMGNLCQLDDYDETLYKLHHSPNDFKYMIATSEQPLTGYYANKKLESLPIKFAGFSSCYRKEAGKHGKDTNGIFRVHQFEKVEQLVLTEPDNSWEMFESMIETAKEFYDSLGISYRVVTIVSGALNNAAAKKYDLEGYFPGSDSYRELVSCSNCTDFFARRLNIRNKKDEYVHILNSTLYANTRTICILLEQYQDATGIRIPDPLVKYVGTNHIDFIN